MRLMLLLAVNMATAGSAVAQGFAVHNQNGAGTGTAYAGAAAVAEDASTVYFNPAGMTYLTAGHHVSGALTLQDRSLKFNDEGSNRFLNAYPRGDDGGQAGGLALIPAGYWTMSVTPDLHVGLGLSPTFGATTQWSDTYIGRYQGVYSEIKAANVNPSMAWRVNEFLSLGVGLDVVAFKAELQGMVPGAALLDNKTKMSGSDIGFGYNFGAMLQFTPATRVGLTYRSTIDLNLKGDVEMLGKKTPANVAVELPDSASIALSHMINDQLELLSDFTWTGWSSIPSLVIKNRSSGAIISEEKLGFKDSFRVGLGMQYRYSKPLVLRAGVAFDQSPVRSAADRTVRMPDSDRIWLAVGSNYKFTEQTAVDFGYAHVFFDQAAINRATSNKPALQVVRGSFDSAVDIFSVQLNHHF